VKTLFPGVFLLVAFSTAWAVEKAPVPLTATGRVSALSSEEDGHLVINGDTFRLLAGKKDYPLDLQERPDLGYLLWIMRHREVTLSGALVEKSWPKVFPLPFGALKASIPVTQEVFRVSGVAVDFDKEPLKPKREDD
jgi:hypothetical protein